MTTPTEVKPSDLAMAVASAQASAQRGNENWRKGKGTAVFLGFRTLNNGALKPKFKILTCNNPDGNEPGSIAGDYFDVGNSDLKKRSIANGKALGFILTLFGEQAVPPAKNVLDEEGAKAYKAFVLSLAQTIDAMKDEEQLMGRGMVISFNCEVNLKSKLDKNGNAYINVMYSHLDETNGNSEEEIVKRRQELDAEKCLP